MKPGVTFFGEALHNNVKSKLESDRGKVDALIVIGTSLSV
jgi:NAD-dependent SIR2 family protein deacetylase